MINSKKALKVILCANSSWYLYNFRKSTIEALISRNCEVIVVAPYDEYVKDLKNLGAEYVSLFLKPRSLNPFVEVLSFINLIYIHSIKKPDIVMNFTPKMNIYSTLAAAFSKSKVINNISGLVIPVDEKSRFFKFILWLYKISQIFADKIFFQNSRDMTLFIENGIKSREYCDLLPGSGVNLSNFSYNESLDDGVVRFMIVCRMLFNKGILSFVEASKFFNKKYGKKVEFHALGFLYESNPKAVSRSMMEEWTLKKLLTYHGSTKNVVPYMSNVDCIVLPSIYSEGTPKSLLEAAALGKPIITTNQPGCSFTVDDKKTGLLCEPGSTKDLIDKIEYMINIGHNSRITMGKLAREKAEKEFNEELVIQKYIECIEL